jgi:hypothetical protein
MRTAFSSLLQDGEHLRGRGGLADVERFAQQIEGLQEDARVHAAIADAVEARDRRRRRTHHLMQERSAGLPAPRR